MENPFETCELAGVLFRRVRVFPDSRGSFKELSRVEALAAAGVTAPIVQVNCSVSRPGVLRGLHYQLKFPQAKLVTVAYGAVHDVVVDCRPASPTFGRWAAFDLTADGGEQLYVPRGFAHGFAVLGDAPAAVVYQCDDYYHPGDEGGLLWNSPALAIPWPVRDPVLSEKDRVLPPFAPDLPFPSVP